MNLGGAAHGDKETKERGVVVLKSRKRLARMVLTERDKKIVAWVNTTGVTTRQQVQTLLFDPGSRSRCQRRLTLLFRNRYLDRLARRGAAVPDVYCLSRRSMNGIRLLRASGVDVSRLRPPSSARLQHVLDIVSCRVQITRGCADAGMQLLNWLGERDLVDLIATEGILPDAYFRVARNDTSGNEKKSSFFLEVERSGKSDRAIREKFRRLGSFYYDGRFLDRFDGKSLRVLFLVAADYGIEPGRRIERLVELAGAVRVTFLRFATLNEFLDASAQEALTTPIWRQPGVPHAVSIVPGSASSVLA